MRLLATDERRHVADVTDAEIRFQDQFVPSCPVSLRRDGMRTLIHPRPSLDCEKSSVYEKSPLNGWDGRG